MMKSEMSFLMWRYAGVTVFVSLPGKITLSYAQASIADLIKELETRSSNTHACVLNTPTHTHSRTVFAGKVLNGYILNRDLLKKVWALTARVARDNPFLTEPFPQPGQVTVTVKRIGQQVPVGSHKEKICSKYLVKHSRSSQTKSLLQNLNSCLRRHTTILKGRQLY